MAYFCFHDDYYELAKAIPKRHRGEFLEAIAAYALDGIEIPLEGLAHTLFENAVKKRLDNANVVKERVEKHRSSQEKTVTDNVTDSVTVTHSETPMRREKREERIKKEKEEKKSPQTFPSDFLKFWQAYPKKIGKKAAYKAWKAASPRPPTSDILTAIDRAKRSEQWQKDDGQYIPNPATWLNQGRWDDEVDIVDTSPVWFRATLRKDLDGHKAGEKLEVSLEGEMGMCRVKTAFGEQGMKFADWFEAQNA